MKLKPKSIPTNSKFLEGIGESAWFYIKETETINEYIISRFSVEGKLECKNIFILKTKGFIFIEDYDITYVSHCARCTVLQNGNEYIFTIK